MNEAIWLALIAAGSSLLTGTLVVAVGVWADSRRKRADLEAKRIEAEAQARAQADGAGMVELSKVRAEYLSRIERLEKRLDDKDAELRGLSKELSDARVMIAQQAARIADLEQDLAQVHRENGT